MSETKKEPIDQGGNVFPSTVSGAFGITLRDYMATKAMQAIVSTHPYEVIKKRVMEGIAEEEYQIADIMIKQRKEEST